MLFFFFLVFLHVCRRSCMSSYDFLAILAWGLVLRVEALAISSVLLFS